MKQTGIMNSRISATVSAMGHTDLIAIVDAGFPIPSSTERIDLSVRSGLPRLMDVLESVLTELCLEEVIIAEEMGTRNAALREELATRLGDVRVTQVTHEELKTMSASCKAVIRTGECRPYANVLLRSGVAF